MEKDDLERGDVIVLPERILPTRAIDAVVELMPDAPDIKNRSQVHLHIGTSETVARVILYDSDVIKKGDKVFCQLRLQYPVIAMSGDRFVIRRLSPVETIGGGVALDPHPFKRRKKDGIEDLKVYGEGALKEILSTKIKKMGAGGMTGKLIEGWIDEQRDEIRKSLDALKKEGKVNLFDNAIIHSDVFAEMGEKIVEILKKYHKEKPLETGMPKEVLRSRLRMENKMFMSLVSRVKGIGMNGDVVHLKEFKVELSGADEKTKTKILDMIKKGIYKPPFKEEVAKELSKSTKEIGDILKILSTKKKLARINDSVYLERDLADKLIVKVKAFFDTKEEMTVGEFRDLLDTSRKYALPYLEYLDSMKITIRVGEVRKLVKR